MVRQRITDHKTFKGVADRLSKKSDMVVLAQASMAHLTPEPFELFHIAVLANPEFCQDALAKLIEGYPALPKGKLYFEA